MNDDEKWLQIKPHAEAIARIFQIDLVKYLFECEFIPKDRTIEPSELLKWSKGLNNQK